MVWDGKLSVKNAGDRLATLYILMTGSNKAVNKDRFTLHILISEYHFTFRA